MKSSPSSKRTGLASWSRILEGGCLQHIFRLPCQKTRPTWNYQAVHIYGQSKCFSEPEALRELVESLTDQYESQFATPWQPEYRPAMLGAIVGIELSISDIQCKYKLSQNRSQQDQQQVIAQLEANGSHQLAEAMRLNKE